MVLFNLMKRKLIVIVGPTASGKTSLGVFLAKKFNGEIVSADSRQVYRGLDLGTGKDLKDYDGIKYHLIDICNPEDKFTLFDWLKLAREAINDIYKRGKLPIVVGGTGLYIQALVEGFEIKNTAKATNAKKYSRKCLNSKSIGELQNILADLAKEKLEKIDKNNPRRLIRAIEIAQEGDEPTKKKPNFESLQIGINLKREELYKKIDKRVDERFRQGMLEEVQGLVGGGINKKWLLSLGLEYKIIGNYVLSEDKDKNSFEKMKQELKYKIHQYARRQLIWFRRFPEIKWVQSKEEAEKLAREFLIGY
jgi:tRNA dimethylallyltransferase